MELLKYGCRLFFYEAHGRGATAPAPPLKTTQLRPWHIERFILNICFSRHGANIIIEIKTFLWPLVGRFVCRSVCHNSKFHFPCSYRSTFCFLLHASRLWFSLNPWQYVLRLCTPVQQNVSVQKVPQKYQHTQLLMEKMAINLITVRSKIAK